MASGAFRPIFLAERQGGGIGGQRGVPNLGLETIPDATDAIRPWRSGAGKGGEVFRTEKGQPRYDRIRPANACRGLP